ncbi:BTB/POZ domain-containing protein At3g05675-like [Andrographis paniculata]|uniref:BTB/POZ domain-containing protein At3g05675-like n=1 Tax=Andrographis paniculata TaxID=175694 RepID=UPI0021E9157A|nr:BTB/POZ domain-containing protein At3g05675-like [Andrographis paniculata]XP_051115372.1 BTB/POZ domain-containing protein At3g05675-like [Andrographis paniculata]XP_051115373.1 BTB/POZ domain-containing protein At3g05675-like [Andrographis paniculata]
MDEHTRIDSVKFGDQCTSDIAVCLKISKEKQEIFHLHSAILKSESTYFANKLADPTNHSCIEIECTELNFEYYIKLLKSLYLPAGALLESWDSVRSVLGILPVAAALNCESIVQSCLQYLEAAPWDDTEEDQIVAEVSLLGPIGMPVLARIQPVDSVASKRVFISAIRFATSVDGPCVSFGDELRASAQEQVEYMLGDDEDMPLVVADKDVKSETTTGLLQIFSTFESALPSLLESGSSKVAEGKIVQSLSDLGWMCNILLKMGLMENFVSKWIDISESILQIIEDKKLECDIWGVKSKLVEVTSKVLDAVGYGNVIQPPQRRLQLVKTWLPYIRKLKPTLDSMTQKDAEFPHKMDEDLCQSIEGAMVSLVSALPSDDQADILADWMNAEQRRYPDLSEAFEVWCFRTKSAKRRLVGGLDRPDKTTVSL